MDLPTPPLQEVTAISRPIDDIAPDIKGVDYQVRNRPPSLDHRTRKVATMARAREPEPRLRVELCTATAWSCAPPWSRALRSRSHAEPHG